MLTMRMRRVTDDDVITLGLGYWRRVRGARSMPSRADIDPIAIRHLLPYVSLVDVLSDPLDFHCRLLGTEVERVSHFNPQGRRFSQSRSYGRGSKAWGDYERTVLSGRPLSAPLAYDGPDRAVRDLRHCLMPLSADGRTVNMIFAVTSITRA
jgi:PAS domain